LLSSPLCAFLGFLLLRHYVRMSTILYRVWCTCTGVEALRQLVMMQPWPPSLPAEAHTYADYPLRRTAALLWYPPPCLFCMFFLAVRQLSYGIREEYGYLRGVTSHRLLRL